MWSPTASAPSTTAIASRPVPSSTSVAKSLINSAGATALATVVSTATTISRVEFTPAVQPTPTLLAPAISDPYAQTPTPFSDNFKDTSNGWGTGDLGDDWGTARRSVANGRYVWVVAATKDRDLFRSGPPAMRPISDFSYSLRCQRVSGSPAVYCGMMFRFSQANYYAFEVNDNQNYAFYLHHNGEFTTLIAPTHSDVIYAGEANRLTVVAAGSDMTLFINDQLVDVVNDSTLTSGIVGVVVDLKSKGDQGTYVFENVEVH